MRSRCLMLLRRRIIPRSMSLSMSLIMPTPVSKWNEWRRRFFTNFALNWIDRLGNFALDRSSKSLWFSFSLQFLRRFSFISSAGDEQHAIGKFLVDMALLDVGCIDLCPSLIAASATYISRYLLHANPSSSFEDCWPKELQVRSPYKSLASLSNGVEILAQCLEKSFSGTTTKEYEVLVKRYEHEQLSKASLYCAQQRSLIQQLAGDASKKWFRRHVAFSVYPFAEWYICNISVQSNVVEILPVFFLLVVNDRFFFLFFSSFSLC